MVQIFKEESRDPRIVGLVQILKGESRDPRTAESVEIFKGERRDQRAADSVEIFKGGSRHPRTVGLVQRGMVAPELLFFYFGRENSVYSLEIQFEACRIRCKKSLVPALTNSQRVRLQTGRVVRNREDRQKIR